MARIMRMGEVYSAGDVVVTVAGMFNVNPSSIEYGYEYEHEYQHGLRRSARGWRMGKKTMEGKITLALDVVAQFEKAAPLGDIARIRPFPINIVFFNVENEMIRDTVIAKFKGNKRMVSLDAEIQNEFDLFVLDINLNIG